jgi:hypothetical protein
MGIIAEFVAESGIGSGVVEIPRKPASAPELCVFPPNSASSIIYRVQPGEEPSEVSRCEANSVGQRCVIAVKACGAQELRLRWTAPPQPDDSIWFAGGFVATDRVSGNPQSDSVAEFAGALQPLGAGTGHESALEGGCNVASGRPGSATWLSLLLTGVVGRVIRQRKRAR